MQIDIFAFLSKISVYAMMNVRHLMAELGFCYDAKRFAQLILSVGVLKAARASLPNSIHLPTELFEEIKNSPEIDILSEKGTYGPIIPACESSQFVFFALKADEKTSMVVATRNARPHKMWLNDRFIALDRLGNVYKISIEPGINYFIFEYLPTTTATEFEVRINTLSGEMQNEYTSFVHANPRTRYNKADIWEHDYQSLNPVPYQCMLTLQDHLCIDVEQACDVEVLEYDDKIPIYTTTTGFYKEQQIDMSRFAQNERLLRLKIHYKDTSGNTYTITKPFFFGDVGQAAEMLKEKTIDVLKSENLSLEEKLFLKNEFLQFLNAERNHKITATNIYLLADAYATVVSQRYINRFLHPGWCPIYYHSKLDGKLLNYSVCLPHDYKPQKTYPLLLRFETTNNNATAPIYAERHIKDIIVADIPLRGVTLGSYMGEASFAEVLNDIFARYRIDRDRIYASGYSNGAYATWLLAQAYPSLFAAVVSYAGGMNKKNIKNLCNLFVVRVESPSDHRYLREGKQYDAGLAKLKNYQMLSVEACTHPAIDYISLNSSVFEELLKHKKDAYPNTIFYRTESNRHLESYWIKIHSIAPSKKYGAISARIKNGSVYITTQNISGVTVQLPPQVDLENGLVFINGKTVHCLRNSTKNNLHFQRTSGGFVLVEKPADMKKKHGSGILDVFFDPLRVINCIPENSFGRKVAHIYSHPRMNTYISKTALAYPVASDVSLLADASQKSSYIVIDQNADNPVLQRIKDHCPVKMSSRGFSYNGNTYIGDYCVMQIVRNPFQPDFNILYINTNKPEMYKSNVFTRNLTLPTYTNGCHPYLNNDILIFYQSKYFVAFDADAKDPLVLVDT